MILPKPPVEFLGCLRLLSAGLHLRGFTQANLTSHFLTIRAAGEVFTVSEVSNGTGADGLISALNTRRLLHVSDQMVKHFQ